jgi:hypothetical protein
VRRLAASVVFLSAPLAAAVAARACPPTVSLEGDPALVAEVTPILASRGISGADGSCPALAVSLERRGKVTLVSQSPAGDRPESREVTDGRTAATVIESWVRTDLEAPLLGHRPAADLESPDRVVATPEREAPRWLQIYTLAETSVASDLTAWVGVRVGGCSMVGPACLGAHLRVSTVAEGPDDWEGVMNRQAMDAVLDADLPRRFGHVGVSPGIGLGLGWIRTTELDRPPDARQTLGLRAETHLSLSYGVSRHFAIESTLALAVGQAIHSETATREPLPSDPRFFAHLGLGIRVEGP